MIRISTVRAAGAAAALAVLLCLASGSAEAQQNALFDTAALQSVGWRGFLDYKFLLESLGALVLAVALGALIAFHPVTPRTVDTVEEAELPKVHLMYALVGAMVGVIVLKFGLVVGFVVFGLGGLMRFRTDTATTRDTGRLIVVTLLGLIAGLNLPHFAVLSAVFAFVLIFVFDSAPACHVEIKRLPEASMAQAADAYRAALATAGCKVLSEKKSFAKHRVDFVFRMPTNATKETLQAAFFAAVPPELRGDVDWEVE